MTTNRVLLVTVSPAAVARLLRPLTRAGLTVDVWTPYGSRIAYSRDVRRVTLLSHSVGGRRLQYRTLAHELSDTDWVILGSDEDIHEVWDASRDDPTCRRLLPFSRRQEALESKAAMSAALDDLGVDQPITIPVATGHRLGPAVSRCGGNAIIKPDRGWSGFGISRATGASVGEDLASRPVVVQEWVDGDLISVEAVVVDGALALASYSEVTGLDGPFGVTFARRYRPMTDARLHADLETIAVGFGGTWFGNLTALRRPDGSHCLIEVDPRPNAWHSYLPRLGYPLAAALTAIRTGGPLPTLAEPSALPVDVANATRIVKARIAGRPAPLRLLASPARSWRHVQRGDAGLTYREARDLARWLVLTRGGRRRAVRPEN